MISILFNKGNHRKRMTAGSPLSSEILTMGFLLLPGPMVPGGEKDGVHILILSNLHLPGRNKVMKQQIITPLNSWEDVSMVIGLGDICSDSGTEGLH